jgi:hypothetical protein
MKWCLLGGVIVKGAMMLYGMVGMSWEVRKAVRGWVEKTETAAEEGVEQAWKAEIVVDIIIVACNIIPFMLFFAVNTVQIYSIFSVSKYSKKLHQE